MDLSQALLCLIGFVSPAADHVALSDLNCRDKVEVLQSAGRADPEEFDIDLIERSQGGSSSSSVIGGG